MDSLFHFGDPIYSLGTRENDVGCFWIIYVCPLIFMWGFWISYCGTTDLSGPTYNYLRPVGTKLINIFRAHMIGYIITSTEDEICGIITVWVRYLFYFGGLGCVWFTNITEKRINRFSRNCQDMSGIIQETVVKIRGSSGASGSDFFHFSQVFVRLLDVWSDCFCLLIYELGLSQFTLSECFLMHIAVAHFVI